MEPETTDTPSPATPAPAEAAAPATEAAEEVNRGPFKVSKAVIEKSSLSRALAWRVKKDPLVLKACLAVALKRSGGEGQKMLVALQAAIKAEFGVQCSEGAMRRILQGLHKSGALSRDNAGSAHVWALGPSLGAAARVVRAPVATGKPAVKAKGEDAQLAQAGAQVVQGLQALGTLVELMVRRSSQEMEALREQVERLEQAVSRAPAGPAVAARAGKAAAKPGRKATKKAAKAAPRKKAGRKPGKAPGAGGPHPKAKEARSLVDAKKPGTEMQRVTCLAYVLVGRDREATFQTRDISRLNNDAGLRQFSNTAVPVKQARQHRYLVAAPKNTLRITEAGIRLVEGMAAGKSK
jgi:hypothetical protein